MARQRAAEPFRRTEFPIHLRRESFEDDGRRKARDIDGAIVDKLERLQPYHSAAPDVHPLWMLHTLNNIDKHRELHLLGGIGRFDGIGITSSQGDVTIENVEPGPVSDGSVHAVIAFNQEPS